MTEMKEIYFSKANQLTVYSDGEHYELEWMSWGHDIKEIRKKIERADFEAYKNGTHSGDDLIFKAQSGVWPAPKEVQDMVKKERAESRPITLISNPKNQKLFSQDELKKLIPLAEKAWIDWKGKLPDNYVSPIKNEK
ncbi:hypothetical protein OfM1_04730 [Lactovum odontotermitis]